MLGLTLIIEVSINIYIYINICVTYEVYYKVFKVSFVKKDLAQF